MRFTSTVTLLVAAAVLTNLFAAALHLTDNLLLPPLNGTVVYRHGEDGFPCIRIPSTIALENNVVLSFAAARGFTGDSCFPSNPSNQSNNYSAHVVKRSTDGGATFGPMVELGRAAANMSPEGASMYVY